MEGMALVYSDDQLVNFTKRMQCYYNVYYEAAEEFLKSDIKVELKHLMYKPSWKKENILRGYLSELRSTRYYIDTCIESILSDYYYYNPQSYAHKYRRFSGYATENDTLVRNYEREVIASTLIKRAYRGINAVINHKYTPEYNREKKRKVYAPQPVPCPSCGRLLRNWVNTGGIETKIPGKFDYPDISDLSIYNYPRICKTCYSHDLGKIYEAETNARIEKVRIAEQRLKECSQAGTCGILDVHHDILKDDPDRLSTSFCIGMTCGIDGLRKYLAKRDNISRKTLDEMSDEEVVEYSEYMDANR